jgi:Zn-dependent protease
VIFRVFGIPTNVQMGFWFMCALLGMDLMRGPYKFLILVWAVVVFLSILFHELGHALAMIRYGLEPEIELHMMGGLARAQGMQNLTRRQRIFISFAGPLAGFVFGTLVFVMALIMPAVDVTLALGAGLPDFFVTTTVPGDGGVALQGAVKMLLWVNFGWGIINLVPVMPLDGGHILEDLLGPRRAKAAATISLIGGIGVVLLCLNADPVQWYIAMLFGMFTMQSYQRFQMAAQAGGRTKPKAKPKTEEAASPEVVAMLEKAQAALADERFDEAGTIAELVIAERPPRPAKIAAFEILGWAHLHEDRPVEAMRVIEAIRSDGEPDLALMGAVLLAQGHEEEAREAFEEARSAGDDRKEIVGPLIQILIGQGEVPRAAAIALDIVESLSEEDARQMANIAFEHESFAWSARLSETVFERTGSPDDAYDGVRSRALDGDLAGALMLLRRAVAAGYSDAARVWADDALEKLRSSDAEGELEALLPRP